MRKGAADFGQKLPVVAGTELDSLRLESVYQTQADSFSRKSK